MLTGAEPGSDHKIELYMGNILVLNYREILREGKSSTAKENKFTIDYSAFIAQLNLIREKSIPIISMSDWLLGADSNYEFAVVLTFDGGFKSDYSLVYPWLKEQGMSATFFPTISTIGEENRMDWAELKEMSGEENGIEIGSQGIFSRSMRKIRKADCKLELELSKRLLEKNIGKEIRLFAPSGGYNRKMLKLAFSAGYKKVFSTKRQFNSFGEAFVLHRWSIRRNTTLATFEKILEKGAQQRTRRTPLSRFFIRTVNFFEIGLLNGIHLFTNQIFQNKAEWK